MVVRRSKRLISWDSRVGVLGGAGVGAQLGGRGLGVWISFHERKPQEALLQGSTLV